MSERSNDWLAQTEIDLLRAERDELYQAMNVSNHRDALQNVKGATERIANLHDLIRRIVTGDGAQLENLDIDDAEWECIAEDHGNDRDHFEVTMTLDDWLAIVRIARAVVVSAPPATKGPRV